LLTGWLGRPQNHMKKQKPNLIPIKDFPKKLRDPVKALEYLRNDPPESWERRGQKMALKLFHEMAERVPAYKDFLKKHGINPKTIETISEFKTLPFIDKDNYLRKYSLADLCWDGKLNEGQWTVTTTSGSTGEPFYFPHTSLQDWQYALIAELYLRTNFDIHKKSTLYVNAFPMGAWIGGVFTHEAITLLSKRGNYKLSIISPGIHKLEVIKAVKKLGSEFDQVIIGGYGPFVKDILDDGNLQGVRWDKYNLKFIFSAESFTEQFRDYVANAAGLKNICKDTLNHYGTVDLGTMSYETPFAIAIRRESLINNRLKENLFGESARLPTLTQYIPELFYFEQIKSAVICSAYSGLPLVRYDLKDVGGALNYDEMLNKFKSANISKNTLVKQENIENTLWKLPFVYVYERANFSVSFYAFQIYPETIKRSLLKDSVVKFVTGKFVMSVGYSKKMDQELNIKVELRNKMIKSTHLKVKIQKAISEQLLEEVSEYRETHKEKGGRVYPKIEVCTYEDGRYFKPGIKQKWITK